MVEYFWSRVPGKFIDKITGDDMSRWTSWCGSVREWHETLIEVVYDVSNHLLRQGVTSEIVQRLELQTGDEIAAMMSTSVLHGIRAGAGVVLVPTLRPDMHEIKFIDHVSNGWYATVHVMDLEA
jgi:hypothetical protein